MVRRCHSLHRLCLVCGGARPLDAAAFSKLEHARAQAVLASSAPCGPLLCSVSWIVRDAHEFAAMLRAVRYALPDIAHHVIECRSLTRQTRETMHPMTMRAIPAGPYIVGAM